jgi:ribosomal-protein-alanine N-acetyltransferase
LVAVANDRVVAYAIFSALNHRGLIVSIAVAPPYRRSGIGSQLLQEALRRLCVRMQVVELQVAVANLGAINFYQHHGFETISRIPHYYGIGSDAYLMRRPCRAPTSGKS